MKSLLAALVLFTALPTLADTTSALDAVVLENAVRGAYWRDETLVVEMEDDGSRRDGFADYLCFVLRDHGVASFGDTRTLVKVIKVKSQVGAPEQTLGAALCPKF